MRYIIATLGCKVNQYESEAMDQILRSHGHESVEEGQQADAILVNSCAVTAEGAWEYFTKIEDMEMPSTPITIIIIGCFSTSFIGTLLSVLSLSHPLVSYNRFCLVEKSS